MNNLSVDGIEWNLSRHAKERIIERKLNPEAVEVVRNYGDLWLVRRDGCARVRISRGRAKRLSCESGFSRRTIDDARETEVVLPPDRRRVITAWRLPADIRFRRSGSRPRIQRGWNKVEE